ALILLDVKFVTKLTLCATDRGVPAPQLRSRPVPSPQPVPQPPALAGPGCNRSLLRGLPARAAGVVRCATGGRPARRPPEPPRTGMRGAAGGHAPWGHGRGARRRQREE